MTRARTFHYLVALTLAHVLVDMSGGMLPPLLPKLMERFATELLGATTLIMFFKIGGNVGQPIFGYLSDRRPGLAGLLPLTPVLTFVPLFMAFVPSYAGLCALLTIGGAALAFFHPNGVREVQALRLPRGAVLSVFLGVGFGGFAAASLISAVIVEKAGLEWVWLPIVPGAAVGVFLWRERRFAERTVADPAAKAGATSEQGAIRSHGYPFALIWLTGSALALTSGTLLNLFPTYTAPRFGSVIPGGAAAMGYGAAGAAAGLLLGALSDRLPRGFVCAAAMLVAGGFLGAFFLGEEMPLVWFSLAGVGPGACFPVLVAMSHEARGRASSLRNGLMVGGCWGAAAILLPAVGAAGDAWGLRRVLPFFALLPPLTCALFVALELLGRRSRRLEASAPIPPPHQV